MTESFDCMKQFVAAYASIVGLLDYAIESWPRPPNEWCRFDDYLALLHQYRPAMAALLTRKGRESPENARSIVANLLSGCAKAKEVAEGTPCPLETLRDVRDWVSELSAPVRQCLALMSQEIEVSRVEEPASHLEILPGGIRCAGHTVELNGKPLACVRALYEAHHRQLNWEALRDGVWSQDAFTEKSTIKNTIKDARAALRRLVHKRDGRLDEAYDPIPCVNHGKDLAWKLDFPG